MVKKKYFIFLLMFLVLSFSLASVYFSLTSFQGVTSENLTMNGSNITRYLNISTYANMSSIALNISGYNIPYGSSIYYGNYTGSYFNVATNAYGITQNGTYFWITDGVSDVYQYYLNGTSTGFSFSTLSTQNIGITQNGTYFWITDDGSNIIYKYYMNGTYTGEYFYGVTSPLGITTDNNFLYISELNGGAIGKYYMNGSYIEDIFSVSPYALSIYTNGTYFWITKTSDSNIYVYNYSGAYLNSFSTIGSNPIGITENGTYFWITDALSNNVYKYNEITSLDAYPSPSIYLSDKNIYSLNQGYLNGTTVYLNQFNDSSTYKNLTFTGNQNKTIYVKLPKNSKVINSSLILNNSLNTGFIGLCYQESANVSNQTGIDGNCGLNYGGTYTTGNARTNPKGGNLTYFNNSYDGDYNTLSYIPFDGNYYGFTVKYIPPIGLSPSSNSITWAIKTFNSTYINKTTSKYYENVSFAQDSRANEVFTPVHYKTISSRLYKCFEDTCGSASVINDFSNNDYRFSNPNGAEAIYDEGIYWNMSVASNVWLDVGNVDGNYEFNYSGNYNYSNTTNDFSSAINAYLSSCTADSNENCNVPLLFHSNTAGYLPILSINITYNNISRIQSTQIVSQNSLASCNCSNCVLNGSYCLVPMNFYSQYGGLNYSNLNLSYSFIPFNISLVSPSNNSVSGDTQIFSCNATSYDIYNLTNSSINIYNATTGQTIFSNYSAKTGLSNTSQFSYTFSSSGTYLWGCGFCNSNDCYNSSINNTILVDLVNPIINQISPSNNQWLKKGSNITFNCSIISALSLDTTFLYGNFTGNYTLNQTKSAVNGTNIFNNNLTDGFYSWTCAVNKTSGIKTFGQQGNYTFGVDTIPPVGKDVITNTIAGSSVFTFISNITDINLNVCNYSILDSITYLPASLSSSGTFQCNNLTSATTGNYGTYILAITATDLAGNVMNQNLSVTTSASSGGTSGGGGGNTGGNIPVIAIKDSNTSRTFTDLEKAIFYSLINAQCGISKNQLPLAIDYSGDCNLYTSDLQKVQLIALNNYTITINTADLNIIYTLYKSGQLKQYYASQSDIDKYHLFTSVLGITTKLSLNPPSAIGKIFLLFNPSDESYTINYIVASNKPLKTCQVVTGSNFNCYATNSTFTISYYFNKTNFFNTIFDGVVVVQTDAPQDQLESKNFKFSFNVFNFGYDFLGMPVYIIFIVVIILTISVITYLFRRLSIARRNKILRNLQIK